MVGTSEHQNFVKDVINPLLFENIELHLTFFKGKVNYDKLSNGTEKEKRTEAANLHRQLDIVLFGGDDVVEGVNNILTKHNLNNEILNDTPLGGAELARLKKQIADNWKAIINNWNVMLPLLDNPSTSLAMVNFLTYLIKRH